MSSHILSLKDAHLFAAVVLYYSISLELSPVRSDEFHVLFEKDTEKKDKKKVLKWFEISISLDWCNWMCQLWGRLHSPRKCEMISEIIKRSCHCISVFVCMLTEKYFISHPRQELILSCHRLFLYSLCVYNVQFCEKNKKTISCLLSHHVLHAISLSLSAHCVFRL